MHKGSEPISPRLHVIGFSILFFKFVIVALVLTITWTDWGFTLTGTFSCGIVDPSPLFGFKAIRINDIKIFIQPITINIGKIKQFNGVVIKSMAVILCKRRSNWAMSFVSYITVFISLTTLMKDSKSYLTVWETYKS